MNISKGGINMENIKTSVYSYNGKEKQFKFKTSLSTYEKLNFVNNVTSLVVGDNYYSLVKDLFFDFVIISSFTDVEIYDFEDNKDDAKVVINKAEYLVNETNIVDIVKANVDYTLIEELKKAVNDNIEYRTGIHKNPLNESLANLLDTVKKQLDTVDVNSMMKMAEIFSGMTGELTPEKMLEVYSKSDMFKNKYAEIMEEKKKHNDKIDELVKDTDKTVLN
jgi:hypothetical protein